MRDFTWHVFTQTGDIEAYLLYKEMNKLGTAGAEPADIPDPLESDSVAEPASP
ncbi:YqzL family protein [Cohnella lubricantis]|uniref:YqzL family protein n=1 Tax=Cohnella lubricantis TaxID=2163172 RepID=A0A841TIH9_9BACL|nr:YqzL family protein [Cohnella lubricantis]MBB6678737.1 YqzL family protein [Cohnella lubricantis]MBP2119805.1 hypothetical protein [Cohnella lubricantis]